MNIAMIAESHDGFAFAVLLCAFFKVNGWVNVG